VRVPARSATRFRSGPGGLFFASLACAAALSGCSILFAIPAQMAKDHSDKRTRTEAAGLRALAPGTLVTMRQRHHEPEAVHFEGFLVADTVAAAPVDSARAIAVFRRGPRRWELPVEEIDWVQLRSSRASIYQWHAVGFGVDIAVFLILLNIFSGLDALGNS
jgi:hypothetical protein